MPIQPWQVPVLTNLLLKYDPSNVKAQYQLVLNELPEAVIPGNANARDAIWALLTAAYRKEKIDDFLQALRPTADIGDRMDEILGLDQPCPTTANLINPKRAFINRSDLRQRLSEILKEDYLAIMAISGDEASGKSHSGHLISHVAEKRGGARPIWLKFSEMMQATLDSAAGGEPTEFEPHELMGFIADPLSLTVRSDLRTTRAQDARIIQKLLTWFEGAFGSRSNPAQPVWLILDDLNFAACPAWVEDFVLGLCARRGRGLLPGLRIFLIGFDRERIEGDADDLALEDRAVPPDREHVWEFLTAAAAEKGRMLRMADKEKTLDVIWGSKPPPLRHQEIRAVANRATAFIGTL